LPRPLDVIKVLRVPDQPPRRPPLGEVLTTGTLAELEFLESPLTAAGARTTRARAGAAE